MIKRHDPDWWNRRPTSASRLSAASRPARFPKSPVLLVLLLLAGTAGWTQDAPPAPPTGDRFLIQPGELPSFELLRYTEGEEIDFTTDYLGTLPIQTGDRATTSVVFPEVPAEAAYSQMTLRGLIDVAADNNLNLLNSRRGVQIARSGTRTEEAPFIPFVDLVGGARYSESIDREVRRTIVEVIPPTPTPVDDSAISPLAGVTPPGSGTADPAGTVVTREVSASRHTSTLTTRGGVESGVNLPTGGSISASGGVQRSNPRVYDWTGTSDTKSYTGNAEIRFLQPLLRGGGYDVGTASLRRARLREMDTILQDHLSERSVVFNVISTYFSLLQAARQLEVSREAIGIRLQFLEETKTRYNLGRVDESEILRAELNYLGELQSATERIRTLRQRREEMLLLLGLPLETPISFVDITEILARRGRIDVPPENISVEEALNNRIELMRSDISLTLAEINKRVARNDTWPNLDFDAGYNRSDEGNKFDDAIGPDNEGWDAGLSLRVPLINIQRREVYKQSILGLEQRKTDRLSEERTLTQEALQARRNLLANEVQLTILRKSVEQARKSLELINGRFEVGFATITEVRLAQDDLFNSQTSYNNALLNYQVAIARLYVALGRPLL